MDDPRPLSSMLGTEVLHDVMDVMLRIPERPLPMAIEDLTAGKTPLAAAITAKGVQASKNDSIRALAEKVAQIQQTPVTFDADDYSAIVSGNGALYDIVKEGLTHIRDEYAAMVVGEFIKNADTIALSGADAYYTSDGDFYTSNTTHTWHDDDTKANRYVIYYFTNEGSDYVIGSTDTCPTSIFVKGEIGNINFAIAGSKCAKIIKHNDAIINDIMFNGTNRWNSSIIIPIEEHNSGYIFKQDSSTNNIANVICTMREISGGSVFYGNAGSTYLNLETVIFPRLKRINGTAYLFEDKLNSTSGYQRTYYGLRRIYLPMLESISSTKTLFDNSYDHGQFENLETLYMPNLTTGVNKLGIIDNTSRGDFCNLIDIEIGAVNENISLNRWTPFIAMSIPTKLAQLNENIRNHIAAKVSDRTGQSALTFTVSTNLYNNLEQATKDAFTAKNWNVVGA